MKITTQEFYQESTIENHQEVFLDAWFQSPNKKLSDVILYWQSYNELSTPSNDWYFYFFWLWKSILPETPDEELVHDAIFEVSLYYSEQAGNASIKRLESLIKKSATE
jgi:hypothetical protein